MKNGFLAFSLAGLPLLYLRSALADEPKPLSPEVTAALAKVGTWDGHTLSAQLQGPYEDPLQQEVAFGRHSYYLSPWRAYMDTWPASKWTQSLGINWNVSDRESEAVAQVMAAAGIRSARVELGWGSFSYDDPSKLSDGGKRFSATLQTLKKFGIRPLILLNANSGYPVPLRQFKAVLAEDAAQGAREVVFKDATQIKPGYTGFTNLVVRRMGFPFVTSVDPATGRAQLSGPLPQAQKAGPVNLVTLRYQPFGGATFADGTPNPAAQETLDGWLTYVAATTKYAQAALGTAGAPDAGFDMEVWNEYTFGSEFLDDKNYNDPPRQYKTPVSYSDHGLTRTGHEIILPMTVDFVNDPKNGLPGVKVLSGFGNQRPWENGADMWPGEGGFSRHYYTGIDAPAKSLLDPDTAPYASSGPINALGLPDGKPDGKDWHTVIPGTFFIPTLIVQMPERMTYAYQTEFMTRDLEPFPGPWKNHFRYANPGTGQAAQMWETEVNTWRWPWVQWVMKETGATQADPRLSLLAQHVGAKSLLRTYAFLAHKGMTTLEVFAAKDNEFSFGVLPTAFYTGLKASNYTLTPEVALQTGEQLQALTRVTSLMKTGQPLGEARPLSVDKLVEWKPRLVFAGDGSPAHPDRFDRDDFAALPFQMDAGRFAVGYYVVTRDVVHEWDKSKDALDPARYDMPPQEFDLTLGNVRGPGARVSATDPLTGAEVPVRILAATPTSLTVRLQTTDSPRFLLIQEAKPGPLIVAPQIKMTGNSALLTFATNGKMGARVAWGVLPERTSGGGPQTLPAGTAHSLTIGDLRPNTGVQVSVESDGLKAVWPRWGYDVAGVGRFVPTPAKGTAVTEQAPASDLRLPALPEAPPAATFSSELPAGLTWTTVGNSRTLTLGTGANSVVVTLSTSPLPPSRLLPLLPEVAITDSVDIHRNDWSGFPAWQGDFALDAAEHPGLAALRQGYYAAPLNSGSLILSFQGSDAGFRAVGRTVSQIFEGVKLAG